MNKKIILTGDVWKNEPDVTIGRAYDVVEESLTGQALRFRTDAGQLQWAYPEDEPGEYSLGCEVFDWPEVSVGDRIRATRGENVLVGTVTKLFESEEGFDFELGVPGDNDNWYLSVDEGFSVEILENAEPQVVFPMGTVVQHRDTGSYIARTINDDTWVNLRNEEDVTANRWTDESVQKWLGRGTLKLVFEPKVAEGA